MNYKLAFALGLIAPGTWRGEQWETVWESTFTTREDNDYNGCSQSQSDLIDAHLFEVGETVRLTINGVARLCTATGDSAVRHLGNRWLGNTPDTTTEDTGEDYNVRSIYLTVVHPQHYARLFTREPGTYTVKVERMVN